MRAVALLLLALRCSHAWLSGALPSALLSTRRSTTVTVQMKHNEHFKRVQQAEGGRLRLCVHRCTPRPRVYSCFHSVRLPLRSLSFSRAVTVGKRSPSRGRS